MMKMETEKMNMQFELEKQKYRMETEKLRRDFEFERGENRQVVEALKNEKELTENKGGENLRGEVKRIVAEILSGTKT